MYDRALQALVKLALEPEWEAIFEPNSYGFRPGRSCHDAIGAIYGAIKQKAKYVLDADISKCFDCINHEALLAKIKTFPRLKRQIKAWLKSGVMDSGQLFPTNEGTPQGGVISPLLANIALHGMENRIKQAAETLPGTKRDNRWATSLIRYADDFVIIHKNKDFVIKCQEIIADWLKDMGLELKPEKTQLVHTSEGFDFLGFNIRQYKVGKHRTGYLNGNPLGFKTIIKPSKDKITRHYRNIADAIDTHKTAPQKAIIGKLNPIIKGWANYYSAVCSKEIYSALDSLSIKSSLHGLNEDTQINL
jgi:RNA-directed DNA polymerase